jgi:wyosine [tRNA(Phe)-imidazoG37] synthetase (radical SAM superfamily)
MNQKLTTSDHSRDIAGLKYVYPVLSRRAGGLSVGINFNTNNACNWRCIYCQVPDLVRGAAPEMDFQLLEWELRFFLQQVLKGDFYDQFNVPEQQRIIKDIAISGNGEPTSLKQFDKAMALIGQIATEMGVLPESHFVLITNGSLMHKSIVEEGLKILNHFQGEVWFKLDSATESGKLKINDSKQTNEKTLQNLTLSSTLCNTSLQTCIVDFLAAKEAEFEKKKYVELLAEIKQRQIKIQKIMLYTIARPSLQPEAKQINKIDEETMEQFANQIRRLDYKVNISL